MNCNFDDFKGHKVKPSVSKEVITAACTTSSPLNRKKSRATSKTWTLLDTVIELA